VRLALPLLLALVSLAPTAFSQRGREPLRIACIGDSITEGTANADWRRNAWPLLLGRLLEAEAPGRYAVRGFARSGATCCSEGRRPLREEDVFPRSVRYRPDLLVVLLGTNDATPENWPGSGASFRRQYEDLLAQYETDRGGPSRTLLLGLPPLFAPYPRIAQQRETRRAVADSLRSLAAARGADFLDLGGAFTGRAALFPDGLHPNTRGNAILAERVAEWVLGRKPQSSLALDLTPPSGPRLRLVDDGRIVDPRLQPGDGWKSEALLEGHGPGLRLAAPVAIGAGPFHLHARLRLIDQRHSAAALHLGPDVFGFEGARGTVFHNGPSFGGLRLLHPSPSLWERDAWFDLDVIREGEEVVFRINGFDVDRALIAGPIDDLAFDPMRARLQIASWWIAGEVTERRALSGRPTLPLIDLDREPGVHVVVDREEGQYLGHVSTCLLEDGRTLLAVYPKGHGRGAIVYKRSRDGGKTWSERLPTPANWASSREVPTIHRVIDPRSGEKALILWSGLYPARLARSEDDGRTWTPSPPGRRMGRHRRDGLRRAHARRVLPRHVPRRRALPAGEREPREPGALPRAGDALFGWRPHVVRAGGGAGGHAPPPLRTGLRPLPGWPQARRSVA
jgi:lysophospholipase L1-like esterase